MKIILLRKRTSKFEQAEPHIENDVQDNKYGEHRNVFKCVIAGREVNFLGHISWKSGGVLDRTILLLTHFLSLHPCFVLLIMI